MKTNKAIFLFYLLLISISCTEEGYLGSDYTGNTGKGGSLARFTIAGNFLYTVDNSTLKTYSLENPGIPEAKDDSDIGFGIETIFPFGNNLFIGSQTGMYIYDISNPLSPLQISRFEHIYSCDPVVSDGQYAYVTLSSTNMCGHFTNELQIINIKNMANPVLEKTYSMLNPKGLGIDNKTLFICDDGLKVYDVSNVQSIKMVNKFNINATDVIPLGNVLLVIGQTGIHQYLYEGNQMKLLSFIPTTLLID